MGVKLTFLHALHLTHLPHAVRDQQVHTTVKNKNDLVAGHSSCHVCSNWLLSYINSLQLTMHIYMHCNHNYRATVETCMLMEAA